MIGAYVVAIVIFVIVPLAMVFWLVELVRAKMAGRPPSWKQPHEPSPWLGKAMWGNPAIPPETASSSDDAKRKNHSAD